VGRSLDVLLGDVLIGRLAEDGQGRVSFRIADEYRHMPNRPVLSQSFEDDLLKIYRGRRGELPAFFANLAPEGPLRDLIESSLQIPAGDELGLLQAVGGDLPGAVELRPGLDEPVGEEDSEAAEIPPDLQEDHGQLRFSLAGVQLKFSVLREGEALTLPVQGQQGEWIVKLDSSRFPQVVENEYATLEWARAAGFPVPECHVEPASVLSPALRGYAGPEGRVFVIRRYDRAGFRRIHQEDFAQVTGLLPRLKYDQITYEQLARTVVGIVGPEAYDDFIRRLAFVIASGNTDAHLKNWSLVYLDGVNAELSPLYDQVCTIAWPELPPELALKLAGMKNLFQIDEKSFLKLAAKADADGDRTISLLRSSLERIADAWAGSGGRGVMPAQHVASLREYWQRAPLLKRHAAAIR
jgi:serine/threonine-protein kinase HipA